MSEKLYVRLKPYDKQAGCLVKRYLYKGVSFATDTNTDRPVWNIMSSKDVDALGLRDLVQPRGPHSTHQPPLLDIMDEDEYTATEGQDRDRYLAMLGVVTETQILTQPDTAIIDRTEKKKGRAAAIPEPEVVPDVPEVLQTPEVEVQTIQPELVRTEAVSEEEAPPSHPSSKKRTRGRPRKKS